METGPAASPSEGKAHHPLKIDAGKNLKRSLWPAKTALVIFTLGACVLMLELGLRMLGRYPGNSLHGFYAQGEASYRLATNISKTVYWPTMTFTVYTDDLGFRVGKPGPRHLGERPYYAMLGSSEVFGNGLDYDKTFVGVCAEKMQCHGIEIVNMAVDGHALDNQIAIFKEFARAAPPPPEKVLVFVNPILINEFDQLHNVFAVRWGYKFPKDRIVLPFISMVLQNKSTAYCFLREKYRHLQMKYVHRKDVDMSFYLDVYSRANRSLTPKRTQQFLAHLRDLEQSIQRMGAAPVYVYVPPPAEFMLKKLVAEGRLDQNAVDTEFHLNLIREHCKAEGLQLINVDPVVQQLADKGQKLNLDLDGHFNALTSRVVGEYLYQCLKPGEGPVAQGNAVNNAANGTVRAEPVRNH